MTSRHGRHWPGLALAVASALALTLPARAQEECVACHDDAVKAFAKTSHGRHFAADADYQSANCTSCHAGAREHAASGGETKPLRLDHGAEASAPCLACHGGRPRQAHWPGSAHQLAGLACAACHNPHEQHGGTPTPIWGRSRTRRARDGDRARSPFPKDPCAS